MVTEYYELHITFKGPLNCDPPRPWKYSQIDGDPVLGVGVKAYLTRQVKSDREIGEVHNLLKEPTKWLFERGHDILRRKIEKVVYDSKEIPEELFNDN
jgi:hypothetical protein